MSKIQFEDKIKIEFNSEREFLYSIVQSIPCTVILISREGTILMLNKGMFDLVGYSVNQILGQNIFNLIKIIKKESITEITNKFKNVLDTGKTCLMELEIIGINGDNEWVKVFASLMQLKQEKFILLFLETITEKKNIEIKLDKTLDDLRMTTDLLTHDMGNIFQNLYMSLYMSDLYHKDGKHSSSDNYNTKIQEISKIFNSQVDKGIRLISNMRNLRDIHNKMSLITIKEIRFEYLKESIDYIVKSVQNKKIQIPVIFIDKILYHLKVNTSKLLIDVFENILFNAVKHNSNNTVIIIIRFELIENNIIIEFQDNGVGISNEQKKELFKEHYKKYTDGKGMGIGLSVIKKIIESYGGLIDIKNNIKGDYTKGSTFIISLPIVNLKE